MDRNLTREKVLGAADTQFGQRGFDGAARKRDVRKVVGLMLAEVEERS